MTTTASEVYADVVLLYKLNIFQSWTFSIKIYNILKNNILTCSCWASVESWLLWRYASRSSLLYSGFRYTIKLPLQPYKIQLYTFRVQGLPFFQPWFPDYKPRTLVIRSTNTRISSVTPKISYEKVTTTLYTRFIFVYHTLCIRSGFFVIRFQCMSAYWIYFSYKGISWLKFYSVTGPLAYWFYCCIFFRSSTIYCLSAIVYTSAITRPTWPILLQWGGHGSWWRYGKSFQASRASDRA